MLVNPYSPLHHQSQPCFHSCLPPSAVGWSPRLPSPLRSSPSWWRRAWPRTSPLPTSTLLSLLASLAACLAPGWAGGRWFSLHSATSPFPSAPPSPGSCLPGGVHRPLCLARLPLRQCPRHRVCPPHGARQPRVFHLSLPAPPSRVTAMVGLAGAAGRGICKLVLGSRYRVPKCCWQEKSSISLFQVPPGPLVTSWKKCWPGNGKNIFFIFQFTSISRFRPLRQI